MNVKWMFLVVSVLAITAGGCHKSLDRQAAAVDVVVDGNKAFPADLAGRWTADEDGWEFVLAPDGRILSAVISLGRVRVIPGQTTTVPTRTGGRGVFTPGQWGVQYAPDSHQLTVKITMDHVRVEMGVSAVEGSSTDLFTGPIDPVQGTWWTLWTTLTKYTGHTPEKPSFDLSTDSMYGETKSLMFRKVANQ